MSAVTPSSAGLHRPEGLPGADARLGAIARTVANGRRLSVVDGLLLYETPAIWSRCETAAGYDAMDWVLATSYGTSLADEFRTFAVWNWFTGTRDDGAHYEEGAAWPLVAAEQ